MPPRSDREHTQSLRLHQSVMGENYNPSFMRAHKEPAWSACPAAATRSLRGDAVFLSVSPQAPLQWKTARQTQPHPQDRSCRNH